MKILECENVCINYDDVRAVDNVSFTVEDGDFVCILGENGSGKSTLVKGILGLEKIQKGTIKYLNGIKPNELGYLPQTTIVQKNFPASIYEVVLSGCLNSKKIIPFYSKKDKQKALEMMKKFEIDNIKNKSYQELSGGQQQRVLLARALCASRKLLILDEPISGLDPVITKKMYQKIKDINKQGMTIIMVSHDINYAIKNASKIIHIKNKLLFEGTPKEYEKSEIGKLFLGGCHHG